MMTAAFLDLKPHFASIDDGAVEGGSGYTLEPAACPAHETDSARWNVLDADRAVLGIVARSGGRRIGRGNAAYTQRTLFRVVTAGPLVKFDVAARYDSVAAAAEVVVEARAADTRHNRDGGGLTLFERDVLDFEEQFLFARPDDGARHQAIRELLGIDATRYYQILANLIRPSDPRAAAAQAYSPVVVNRLRRLTETRRRAAMPRLPRR